MTHQTELPTMLTVDEIEQAFDEAFPRHEMHQESVDFARAVERLLLEKLHTCAWQSMQTAPRNGEVILVLPEGIDIPCAVRWLCADAKRGSGVEGWHTTWDGYRIRNPTHWMPLPPPPEQRT